MEGKQNKTHNERSTNWTASARTKINNAEIDFETSRMRYVRAEKSSNTRKQSASKLGCVSQTPDKSTYFVRETRAPIVSSDYEDVPPAAKL